MIDWIGMTPVEIWITLGTPAIRDAVWPLTWVEWVKAQQKTYDVIVCPDTRFPNEIAACDCTIKIVNPRIPDRQGKSVDHLLDGFANWDFTITNDTGFSELRGQANMIAALVFKDYEP